MLLLGGKFSAELEFCKIGPRSIFLLTSKNKCALTHFKKNN
jgi:hypothetical protein